MRWIPWAITFVAVATLLGMARCTARNGTLRDAKLAALRSTIAADRKVLAAKIEQLRLDSIARVRAEHVAAEAHRVAAAQKARSDSLDARVRILSDSVVVLDARDTVTLPRLVIVELTELRKTVRDQAIALVADTISIKALEAELATARGAIAGAVTLSGHQDEKVATLETSRPGWLHGLVSVVITAGSAAGCGAVGAIVAGPAGAAIGAAGCVVLTKVASP